MRSTGKAVVPEMVERQGSRTDRSGWSKRPDAHLANSGSLGVVEETRSQSRSRSSRQKLSLVDCEHSWFGLAGLRLGGLLRRRHQRLTTTCPQTDYVKSYLEV